DSYRASYRLVPASLRHLCVIPDLPHNRYVRTFPEVDQFMDNVLRNGTPLPRLRPTKISGDLVTTTAISSVPIKEASLLYTTNTGDWHDRRWQTIPAQIKGDTISAQLPSQRPLSWYLLVTDQR